jgi:hypothetical protein
MSPWRFNTWSVATVGKAAADAQRKVKPGDSRRGELGPKGPGEPSRRGEAG